MSNIKVRVGQQNAVKVLSSNSAVLAGITIKDEGVIIGSPGGFNVLNFVGNGFEATGNSSEVTITIYDATTSTKGVASYNPLEFYVLNGVVGLVTERITDIIGATVTLGIQTNISLTYDDFNNVINAYVATATTTTLGVAAFNPNGLSVQNGYVSVKVGAGITIENEKISFRNNTSLQNNKLVKWDTTNLQLTNTLIGDNSSYVTVYSDLYFNNPCTDGEVKVLGCDSNELSLLNTVIDCGEY
jgi:hypothetical protein